MATLATLWKTNIEVCFEHQQLSRRRYGNLFRRHSGGVPAICLNAHWNNLVATIRLYFSRHSTSLWTPKQVVYDAHDNLADVWLGGDSPWVCRIIGISLDPQIGSLYNEAIWDSDARI